MSKRGPGKDIAGKIVDFLREKDGNARVSMKEATNQWACSVQAAYYSLAKLRKAGIVKVLRKEEEKSDNRFRAVELALIDEYREGNSWRKALKRKSSGGESGASPGITARLPKQPTPAKAHTDDECLQYRITLSRDLLEVYKRLKDAQGQIARLQDEIGAKDKKIEDLTGEIEAEAKARKREVEELATLELQLRKLRNKTSDPGKRIRFDGSGVIIAEGEGLTDGS